jgi:hypothetical protein
MERKKVIIEEIKYWKKNRLLPEQYCNFLLSLYTEGEELGSEEKIKPSQTKLPLVLSTFGLALFGLTILVIYFTDFSPFLQMALVIILLLIMFLLVIQGKRFDPPLMHLFILLGAFMILIATVHSVGLIFPNQPLASFGAVIFTCFTWLYFGNKYNLKYLIFSSVFGIAILIYFMIS